MAKKNNEKETEKKNIWKIVSIVFIVLFVLVLISGLWRAYTFRPAFDLANASQIEAAKNIAVSDLASRGENVASYQFKVSDKIREIPGDAENKKVLEVNVYNESVHNMYIIDVQSGAILMYSKTEFYDGLNHELNHSEDKPVGPKPEGVGGLLRR